MIPCSCTTRSKSPRAGHRGPERGCVDVIRHALTKTQTAGEPTTLSIPKDISLILIIQGSFQFERICVFRGSRKKEPLLLHECTGPATPAYRVKKS